MVNFVLFASFAELFRSEGGAPLWASILTALLFYCFDWILFLACYAVRMSLLLEFGYPKRNFKYRQRMKHQYSVLDRILMYKVAKNVQQKSKLVTLELALQFFNIFSLVISTVGFISAIITRLAGGAGVLVLCSQLLSMMLQSLIDLFPSRIFSREIQKQNSFAKIYEKIYNSFMKHKK